MKNYPPVQIRNPTADGHLVRLHANQGLVIVCTEDMYEDLTVHENTDFLVLDQIEYLHQGVAYHYKQSLDLTKWKDISSIYLGEINFTSKYLSAWLCVFLESASKSVVTIINPQNHTVKVEPHEVIEVVVYSFEPQPDWKHYFNHSAFLLEEINRENQQSFACFGPQERHFWFRYDRRAIERFQKMNAGVYHSGQLIFAEKGIEKNSVNLSLRLRDKNRNKMRSALVCPKLNHFPLHNNGMHRTTDLGPLVRDVELKKISGSIDFGCRVEIHES